MPSGAQRAYAFLSKFFRHPALWTVSAVLIFASVLLLAFKPCFTADIGTLDYPIQIISVQRILNGERPYRDFQVLYGPLGHYIAAACQWPMRHMPRVVAFQWYVYGALAVFFTIICFRFSRLRLARPFFFIGSILLLLKAANPLAVLASYSLAMTLPIILSTLLLPLSVATATAKTGRTLLCQIACGLLIGAQILIRINYGAYLVIAILITGILAYFLGRRSVAVAALRCLIFAGVAVCVLVAFFAAAGIASPALADMRQYLPRATAGRPLPWKYNSDHPTFYYTLFCVICFFCTAALRLRRRQVGFWLVPYLLLGMFFSYAMFRFDPVHVLPFLLIAFLLLFERVEDESETRKASMRWVGLPELQVLALLLLLLKNPAFPTTALMPSHPHLGLSKLWQGVKPVSTGQWLPTPVVAAVVRHNVTIQPEEAAMLDKLDGLRKPGDEIFWASTPGSCQSTFDLCANLTLYLADDVLPKQKIWYFDTGSTPYADVQQTLIQGLQTANTPWIGMQDVYQHDLRVIAHPESSLLQDFVKSNYDLVFTTEIPRINRRFAIYAKRPHA